MAKNILKTGKRKTAIARATLVKGKGMLRINNEDFSSYINNPLLQLKVEEPMIIANIEGKYDIKVNVFGGGQTSQVDAIRQAIARALVEEKGDSLKKTYLDYDRSLLVSDTRFKETNKPNCSKARSKRQKSYR